MSNTYKAKARGVVWFEVDVTVTAENQEEAEDIVIDLVETGNNLGLIQNIVFSDYEVEEVEFI